MSKVAAREATFFATPANFRAWLKTHSRRDAELWVGFYKRDSGKQSITWPESVDEALCFGWIDGLRQRIDAISYRIRFTPRKPASNWSAINIARVKALTALGRMQAAGEKAFAARSEQRTKVYSHENTDIALAPAYEARLRSNKKAAAYFDEQMPSYRKAARRWIMSAKREDTRESRLSTLIEYSARREYIPPFKWSLSAPGREKLRAGRKARPR